MSTLAGLSPRERMLVLLVLPLVMLLAGWSFGWQPLENLRSTREAEIASYRLVAQSAAEARARPDAGAGGETDAAPFAARVTSSAEAAGLSLSRLEPEGERLRVTLEEASFAQVVLWISDLEAEQGVALAAIEMDRRTAPSVVSARLLLEPSQ